ncbi:aromatic prenyltransferase [Hypomontagnella submonticulosa]|nr:aromatic prenyltransferase [Hypomontagnella submonticulosa]
MNGHATTKDAVPNSPTWAIASKWLEGTAQTQPWWTLIGSQLSTLAHESQYSVERQLDVLLFLYSQVLPRVGTLYSPKKSSEWSRRWASLLTNDGSPFEYSWKWNSSSTDTPEIRYCIEAIGSHTGTSGDPFNYLETERLLVDELAPRLSQPQLDLTWHHHFTKALGISDRKPAPMNPEAPPSSMFVAFEHVAKGTVVKTYYLPASDPESGGAPTFTTFANAARGILHNTESLDAVMDYVARDPVGLTMTPDMLAIDCVDPTKSRLKLYASSPESSFASIVSVITLGGSISNMEKGIDELRSLLVSVLGLDHEAFSPTDELLVRDVFDAGLARAFDLYGRMTYYFDIAPNSALPDVKLYIPVIRYARSDDAVAAGLAEYLHSRQRGQYHEGFVRALSKIGEGHAEGSGHRLQTYLAVGFQRDGSLAITSYINPGVYHASLKQQQQQQINKS